MSRWNFERANCIDIVLWLWKIHALSQFNVLRKWKSFITIECYQMWSENAIRLTQSRSTAFGVLCAPFLFSVFLSLPPNKMYTFHYRVEIMQYLLKDNWAAKRGTNLQMHTQTRTHRDRQSLMREHSEYGHYTARRNFDERKKKNSFNFRSFCIPFHSIPLHSAPFDYSRFGCVPYFTPNGDYHNYVNDNELK